MNNKTDSREKMVEAASKLFQLKGYHATGLNEILKESYAPKGSLYYYFPNGKEELALAAIELAGGIIQNKIKVSLSKYTNPSRAIQNVISDMKTALDEEGELQNISISLLALETYLSSETLREACNRSFEDLENIYAQKLIENGVPLEIAQDLGMVIQAMIEGAITISITKKDTAPLSAVAKQIDVLIRQYYSA
ncbi:transcriptional regulator, TetR family [Anaerocolumna jejuensis DSM 15929]|uniref:Transcriptional regulator, TetR family n=1 Tax=Anaerocolumna jejuensis DSM 15929 TaxID=1121322 RepID=A0A1M7BV59_9FIRM|nr:TetR/AcrR family transcriptional regulator [Anaerocolumna jejuensis]SHL58756.1 transcriptional regulator, TetR family [Anaerocolumna jejuensis DSM 15929]